MPPPTSEILSEIKLGLHKSSRYILSHHTEEELYRCYALKLRTKEIHLCSRCLGIYAGIICGFLLHTFTLVSPVHYLPFIMIFPLFALLDWSLSAFAGWRGHNLLRTLSGLALGIAYALGITLLISGDFRVLRVGIAYTLIAAHLLWLKHFYTKAPRGMPMR